MVKRFCFILFFIIGSKISKAQSPTLQWAKQISGATGNDFIEGIVSDNNGNTFSTGFYIGPTDFDPGASTYTLTQYGYQDAFILKLDPNGNLVWAKGFGGPSYEHAFAICLDLKGNIYVTGYFMGTCDFDPGPATYTYNSVSGNADIFISKFSSSGNLIWVKQIGNTAGDVAYDVKVDGLGNVYSTGSFKGAVDFDPGPGVFNLTSTSASEDIFISKLDSNGNFVWAKQVIGTANDVGKSLALDKFKNVLVTGDFAATADFDPGPGVSNLTSTTPNSDFILKLDSAGNYVWANNFIASATVFGRAIFTDTLNNVLSTGIIAGATDFDPGPGTYTLNATFGATNSYISKLSPSGNFIWAKVLSGPNGNISFDIVTDQLNNVYTTGHFLDTTDFDPGLSSYTINPVGNWDAFALKLDASGNFKWAASMGGSVFDMGQAICSNSMNEIFVSGQFATTSDFDPGPGTYTLTSGGYQDGFIVKFSGLSMGINSATKEDNLGMFPNPCNEFLNFELSTEAIVIVSNVFGQELIKENKFSGKQKINLQNQPNGVYFVKIIQEGKQYTGKIIKE